MDFDQDWFPCCTECGTKATEFNFETGAWMCPNRRCFALEFYTWRPLPNIDPTESP